MRIKLILLSFLLGVSALANTGLPEPKGNVRIYVIRPGDCLWNISKKFFDNPFLWPRLWKLNPYIKNPDLIYPGDQLVLKPNGQSGSAVSSGPDTTPGRNDAPASVYLYSTAGSEGFITTEEWKHTGTIIASEPEKLLHAEGDIVYVNVGSSDGIHPSDRFTVFSSSKPVLHPVTNEKIGYKTTILGEVEITEVLNEKLAAAKVITSIKEIKKGARIASSGPVVRDITLKRGIDRREGFIVENLNDVAESANGDIVYIDLGNNDQITAGNTFAIYKPDREVRDPDTKKKVVIPPAFVGRLLVLDTKDRISSAMIIESEREIEKGDMISLDF